MSSVKRKCRSHQTRSISEVFPNVSDMVEGAKFVHVAALGAKGCHCRNPPPCFACHPSLVSNLRMRGC